MPQLSAGIKAAVLLLWCAGGPASAFPDFFGYVGVMCGHDDPHDGAAVTDYAAEVAGFTNANHICLTGDPGGWAAQLALADRLFRPIVSVEPLFDLAGAGPDGSRARMLWAAFVQAVQDSGIDPARLVLHLVDEPTLRGIAPEWVGRAARIAAESLPAADRMVIEACRMEGPPAPAPDLTLWGFDCYTIPDPATNPAYMAFLRLALAQMLPSMGLVLVLDATHTPNHQASGLAPEDMGNVALAYARLALDHPRVAGVIAYAWPGGIDGGHERGVRDLPAAVIEAHRQVGAMLLGPHSGDP